MSCSSVVVTGGLAGEGQNPVKNRQSLHGSQVEVQLG